jgi:hypothetical protein
MGVVWDHAGGNWVAMVFGVSELQVLNSVVMNDELFIFVFESKLEQIHSREFIFRLSSLPLKARVGWVLQSRSAGPRV